MKPVQQTISPDAAARIMQTLTAVEVLLSRAWRELRRLAPVAAEKTKPELATLILSEVCREFNVEAAALRGPRRPDRLATPRHVFWWLCRDLAVMDARHSARFLNKQSPDTARYGRRNVENLRETNDSFRVRVDELRARIVAAYGRRTGGGQ